MHHTGLSISCSSSDSTNESAMGRGYGLGLAPGLGLGLGSTSSIWWRHKGSGAQQPEQSQPNAVSSSQLNDEAKSAHWWRRHWRRHADGGGHVDG